MLPSEYIVVSIVDCAFSNKLLLLSIKCIFMLFDSLRYNG